MIFQPMICDLSMLYLLGYILHDRGVGWGIQATRHFQQKIRHLQHHFVSTGALVQVTHPVLGMEKLTQDYEAVV